MTGMMASPVRDGAGTEYRIDFRGAGYPGGTARNPAMSVYDAYVGQRFAGGTFVLRAGQMWVNDLGGLGSLGGVLAEVVRPDVGGLRRLRIGFFGGYEPQLLQLGYVGGVVKTGGYVTLEGKGAWRNTAGVVIVRNAGLTERAVLTTTNFLPIGKRVFVYQAAEYDMVGPGGKGSGGLSYLFLNGRATPNPVIEFQADYHRGRSIDFRGITLDQLAGRPVSAKSLEGLRYESAGGRATVTVFKNMRIYAGYSRDRNNREDAPTYRLLYGGYASDLFRTGIDLRFSDARTNGPSIKYDSWDVSVGRSIGRRIYGSFDYTTSLSRFQTLGQDQFVITTQPRTNMYSLSGLFRLSRRISVLATLDRTRDGDLRELRWLTSVIYRF
jgi:hypothetical protein